MPTNPQRRSLTDGASTNKDTRHSGRNPQAPPNCPTSLHMSIPSTASSGVTSPPQTSRSPFLQVMKSERRVLGDPVYPILQEVVRRCRCRRHPSLNAGRGMAQTTAANARLPATLSPNGSGVQSIWGYVAPGGQGRYWALRPDHRRHQRHRAGVRVHHATFENGKLVEQPPIQEVIGKPRDQGCMDGLRDAGWGGR
jgi:hypothetical protein